MTQAAAPIPGHARGLSEVCCPGSVVVVIKPNLLLVDDDEVYRTRLARAIAARGYNVRTAGAAPAAMAAAEAERPDYAVLDLRMPGDDGLVLLRQLREIAPDLRAVMLTGHGSIATVMEAVHLGAVNFLTKPADVDDILAALRPEGAGATKGTAAGATTLAKLAWEQIHRVMLDCGGDLPEAARRLGMSRRTLQRRAFRQRPGH